MFVIEGEYVKVNGFLFGALVALSMFALIGMAVVSSIDGPTEALERSVEQNKFCEKHGMVLEHRLYEKPRCVKKEN